MRIEPHMPSQIPGSALGNTTLGQPAQTEMRPVGEQLRETLFRRNQPHPLALEAFPELAALVTLLNGYRRKLALLAGDVDADYRLVLTDDAIAAVDGEGNIYLGIAFLRGHQGSLDTLVGAIAHEIGHRPKRLKALNRSLPDGLTTRQLQALCLHEEIRADHFAGRALAEVGLSCEPLIAFLKAVQVRPHPEYLPADERAHVIREAFGKSDVRARAREKLFPEFHRHTNVRSHIGEF